MTQDDVPAWIRSARESGLADLLAMTLDALAPLGLLGAQLLWAAQPALSLFVGRDSVTRLARRLEEPGGMDALRRYLQGEPPVEPQ